MMIRPFLRRSVVVCLAFLFALATQAHADEPTRLLQDPSISAEHLVFHHAGDVWVTAHTGGDARRLTSFEGVVSRPRISPDGQYVAFSGRYQGQTDVYVVSIEGGTPQRLTYHPGGDAVQSWSPDSERIVFTSSRDAAPASYARFFEIGLEGGHAEPLPIPRGDVGGYSPDGNSFVYQPITRWQDHWRAYRGGQVHPLWILDLETYDLTELPYEETVDTRPVWHEDTVYFLSDRADGIMNIWAYDVNTQDLTQLTDHTAFDVKALDVTDGLLVYEQAGYLHSMDPAGGASTQLDITVRGDLPWTQPQWSSVHNNINNAGLSPSGVRAVFEARGEIFTVPREEGTWRNISNAPAHADRFPSWSPDGEQIAYFSDRNGEYQLLIGAQDGRDDPTVIDLPTSFYYHPQWSPDGSHLMFTDADRTLWLLEVETEELTEVDRDLYAHPERSLNPSWSPDGRWIAYAKRMHNQFRTINAYSLETGASVEITDGMADAVHPVWDASGKYLYFMASTNYGLNTGWLDMSSYDRPIDRAVYVTVLRDDIPSPLLPRSDEEGTDDPEAEEDEAPEVRIDLEGIDQRILAIDGIPERNYQFLTAASEGVLFYGENVPNEQGLRVHRYDLQQRQARPFMQRIGHFSVSHDGQRALYSSGSTWGIVDTAADPDVGDGEINVAAMRKDVRPHVEWQQLFDEAWRLNRDFLYVDNFHGADWDEIRDLYEPWLDHVHHRQDLNYLLALMVGELSLGHTYTGGGDVPDGEGPGTGLLGVDFGVDNNRYTLDRIYDGESWNPNLQAPLRAPGLNISEGDYLIAVDGRELTIDMNPYELFQGTVGRQVTLLINDAPSREGAREATVVPVGNEGQLRTRAWVEDNRRVVEEASDGRLGYVWVPNTAQAGYDSFNRYYFAQQDRDGIVVDERFNGGGSAADYMVDIMARELHGFFNNPIADRDPFTTPGAGIWGPKVMIINEAAGSGGDLLPYMFRRMDIGPLIGRRTWGGLVGIWDTPPLTDGGTLTVPRGGFYDLDGEWAVENEGVAPDIEVVQTPPEVIEGGDPQLERAIQEALNRLPAEDPILPEPEPPIHSPRANQ